MGFMVRKAAHRAWPVTVTLNVGDDAGQVSVVEQAFVGHFKPFTEADHDAVCDEVDALFPKPDDGKALAPKDVLRRNAAYFERLMCGWGDLADETGAPLPWSPHALEVLVTGPDGHAISEGLFLAIAELRLGVAPAKNFVTSPAPGDSPSASEVGTTATSQT